MLWRCTSCSTRNRGRELLCGKCGSPKDGSETYEMPDDTSAANAVTDAATLALARGGANWSCQYCGSDVRRRDGACGRCGAGEFRAEKAARAGRVVAKPRTSYVIYGSIAAAVVVLLFIGLAVRRPPRLPAPPAQAAPVVPEFVDYDAVVSARTWKRTVVVERNQLWPFEGFAESKPTDAVEVKDLGQRVHHYDDVLDGYDTKTWSEQVQDGYDSQSYTASEACGQTCASKPQSCKNVCTPNKNGFASCRNVCSGGGQSCSTKYCTVTKTRQVPRYKSVTKSKPVPRYRKEPRHATFYSWRAMAFRPVRTLEKAGTDEAPVWPSDAEIALVKDERKLATEQYEVRLTYDAKEHVYRPTNEQTFLTLPLASKHRLRVTRYGAVELLVADAGP